MPDRNYGHIENRVLLTGATGVIGRPLVAALVAQGVDVVAANRTVSPLLPPEVHQVAVGDLALPRDWSAPLQNVQSVIHLAARVHIIAPQGGATLTEFRQINRDATLNLARQAAAAGVKRFVFLSSIKVNGENSRDGHPFHADDEPCPLDPYAVAKFEAEQGLLELAAKGDMEVVIIRPSLVYGPGVKANFLLMMRAVARGWPLPLGRIHNKRSLVGIANLLDLLLTCLSHPAAANQIFLASDGEDLSTTELLRRLGRALGKPARLVPVPQSLLEFGLKMAGKKDLAQRLCGSLQVDISKAKNLLGWQPPLSVDEGLKKTTDWYRRSKN